MPPTGRQPAKLPTSRIFLTPPRADPWRRGAVVQSRHGAVCPRAVHGQHGVTVTSGSGSGSRDDCGRAADRRPTGLVPVPADHAAGSPHRSGVEGVSQRLGRAVRTQLVEVLGPAQAAEVDGARGRSLLRVLGVPDPRPRSTSRRTARCSTRDFAIPLIGHWPVLGFLQDFIALMALLRHRHVRHHPAGELAGAARPQVAVQGLAPRGRLARPVHDLQRHLDDVPVPRRGRRRRGTCRTTTGRSSRTPSAGCSTA